MLRNQLTMYRIHSLASYCLSHHSEKTCTCTLTDYPCFIMFFHTLPEKLKAHYVFPHNNVFKKRIFQYTEKVTRKPATYENFVTLYVSILLFSDHFCAFKSLSILHCFRRRFLSYDFLVILIE